MAVDFQGGSYRIAHQDTNTILHVTLTIDGEIIAQPGTMVMRDSTIELTKKTKCSLKKIFSNDEMSPLTYTGPGEIVFAPAIWGDIKAIRLDDRTKWAVVRGRFLAMTSKVLEEPKSENWSQTFFSNQGPFIQQFRGEGFLFVTSFGALIDRTLGVNEKVMVDHGHLVAWEWTCKVEQPNADVVSGEKLAYQCTGPGRIYIQTRNSDALTEWIATQLHDHK